jgi:disulfide bond formation protein DsbB
MQENSPLQTAERLLDRILTFFPRLEAKSSVILGVDTGMLSLLVAALPPFRSANEIEIVSYALCVAAAVALLSASLYQVYHQARPYLSGGHRSLVYFKQIAERTEHDFIDEFTRASSDDLAKDVLAQAHRNSEILAEKYDRLNIAFKYLAIATPFWLIAYAIAIVLNTESGGH